MNSALFLFFYNFSHRWPLLDQLIVFLAVYFPYVVLALAAWILLLKYKSWQHFFIVFCSAGAAWVLAHVFKALIHASRPLLSLPSQALFPVDTYAFPSGHAALFFALAISLTFIHRKTGYWFLLFAFLISLARIMAGVHSPLDILGGLVLGSLVAYLTRPILGKFAIYREKL